MTHFERKTSDRMCNKLFLCISFHDLDMKDLIPINKNTPPKQTMKNN